LYPENYMFLCGEVLKNTDDNILKNTHLGCAFVSRRLQIEISRRFHEICGAFGFSGALLDVFGVYIFAG
jgi:hypothetical protein